MLKFYRHSETKFTEWVADKLEEMVVAHKLINVQDDTKLPNGVNRESLPVLTDGHESWKSEDKIKAFLEKLHQDLLLSQSLQSDACHLDPDNPEECL